MNSSQMHRNFDYIRQDMRVAVVYEGTTAFGSAGMVEVEQNVEMIGILNDYTKSVWVSPSEFSAELKPNKAITVDGESFRILSVVNDPMGVHARIDIGDVNS